MAANWDKALLDNLKGLPVHSVYGKLASDVLGGGRASYLLPEPSRKEVEAYVRQAHKRKIKFNYLLNPVCTGNKEYAAASHREIIGYLEWVNGLRPDYVTVAAPWLLQVIKRRFPGLKIAVSALANINSLQLAKFYEGLGAEVIILPEHVNRDFRFLEALRKGVECDIQLIANMTCLYGCPFQLYHGNVISHSSRSGEGAEGFYLDYCVMSCTRAKLLFPGEIIKSRWIRPEDLHVYEELGLDHFKLIERYDTTATLVRAARAYSARRYEGNLLDIMNAKTDPARQFPVPLKCLRAMDYPQALKLRDLRSALYLKEQYLDNRALDGFLDFFKTADCRKLSCKKCGYCGRVAKKAFRISPAAVKRNLKKLDGKLGGFVAGAEGRPGKAARAGRADRL